MVNRYQESYLFALSSISSVRSFTWTGEDRDTRELTAQVSSYISTLVTGLMLFRSGGILFFFFSDSTDDENDSN